MKRHPRAHCGARVVGRRLAGRPGGLDPAQAAQAGDRLLADLQRRLLGPALQPARRRSTTTNVDALSLAWVYRVERRRRRAVG